MGFATKSYNVPEMSLRKIEESLQDFFISVVRVGAEECCYIEISNLIHRGRKSLSLKIPQE